MKYYSIKNTTTGEVLEMLVSHPAKRLEEYRACSQMAVQLNQEHRAGSAHLVEFHDAEEQHYSVIDLEDGHLIGTGN